MMRLLNPRAAAAFLTLALCVPMAGSARAGDGFQPSAYDAKLIDLGRRYMARSMQISPTSATDAGIHAYDTRLADYSAAAQAADVLQLRAFRNELAALEPQTGASAHDRVDYLLLRADIEGDWWGRTVLKSLSRDPSMYEGECTNGVFSLIKKPFASAETRVRDAIARMLACPGVLAAGKANLTDTVREFAQVASEDIAGGDGLYTTSLNVLARGTSAKTHADLAAAQKVALTALHAYKKWLDANLTSFHAGGFAVGKEQYDWYLRRVLLLPFDSDEIAAIGRIDLARDRALEAWEENHDLYAPPGAKQPAFTSKEAFLAYYERSLQKLRTFVTTHGIVDIPSYVGPFHIVQVPKALADIYPGGFMNPPGMFDKDPEGFYFVPDFDPRNVSFFAAEARQSVLPVLGHEGIPGHFLQFSYAYHNPDYVRHMQGDSVFAEGWAFYGEEMLMRAGLYDNDPAARRQVIHLMRHRATRVGVDVGLATGTMSLPQAIAYFQKNAGIDYATAYGEGTRFAIGPGQAIDYLIGKTQIETLLGMLRDREGAGFSLRRFHDRLLSYGTVPFSLIRYEWLGDESWLKSSLEPIAPQEF